MILSFSALLSNVSHQFFKKSPKNGKSIHRTDNWHTMPEIKPLIINHLKFRHAVSNTTGIIQTTTNTTNKKQLQ